MRRSALVQLRRHLGNGSFGVAAYSEAPRAPREGNTVTTVDFYVESAAGESLLSFHNGMSGPATDLLHTTFQLAQAGKMAPTRYNVAEMKSVVTGAVLRELLESVEVESTDPYTSSTADDVASVLAEIVDDASYVVDGLEV